MVLKSTLDYLAQPLDNADLSTLRHMVVCGATTLVVVMIGFSRFIIIAFYLLVFGIILIITWLYSLESRKRAMVIERIKEVINSLTRTCIDEALDCDGHRAKADNTRRDDGRMTVPEVIDGAAFQFTYPFPIGPGGVTVTVGEQSDEATAVDRSQAVTAASTLSEAVPDETRREIVDVFSKLLE